MTNPFAAARVVGRRRHPARTAKSRVAALQFLSSGGDASLNSAKDLIGRVRHSGALVFLPSGLSSRMEIHLDAAEVNGATNRIDHEGADAFAFTQHCFELRTQLRPNANSR